MSKQGFYTKNLLKAIKDNQEAFEQCLAVSLSRLTRTNMVTYG